MARASTGHTSGAGGFRLLHCRRAGVWDYWLGDLVLGMARAGGVGMSENDMAKIARLVTDPHADETAALRARVAKLEAALTTAYHALESYAHDNASTELAVSVAAHCKAALSETVEA